MLTPQHVLLHLTHDQQLPSMKAGQFTQVRIENSSATFLRRPFSINLLDHDRNELWLLIHIVGVATAALAQMKIGDKLNCILPLGNGFSNAKKGERILLVGGGVGIAPLLFLGSQISAAGAEPIFLLGAKTKNDLLELDQFAKLGRVCVTTEDNSLGTQGMVTNHSILCQEQFDRIQACGPKPMMMGIAKYAMQHDTPCEVSIENIMACGIGACLCCVEKTIEGNKCVCTEGPVFNIKQLTWHI